MKAAVVLCLCSSLVIGASAGWAATPTSTPYRVAVASIKIDGVTHKAKVKLNARGKIVPWSKHRWASVSPRGTPRGGGSLFFWLGQNRETSGIEWERAGKARNGFGLVTVGTTADSVTLGVSLETGKGFFKYQDLGSGNGNSRYVLTVKESKKK